MSDDQSSGAATTAGKTEVADEADLPRTPPAEARHASAAGLGGPPPAPSGGPPPAPSGRPPTDQTGGPSTDRDWSRPPYGAPPPPASTRTAGATGAPRDASTTVLPGAGGRPTRPTATRGAGPDPRVAPARPSSRSTGRARRARLVVQRLDPWSVFLFSLVGSICLGVVLLVAVAALYFVLSALGVLASVNGVLGEVLGGSGPDGVVEPYITAGRVLGGTAVLAAVDVVLLTALATLGALLYNLCSSLTGGIEVVLGERD